MIKVAPSLGRILAMVVFAFSCFGILLFLWLQFGGATPLKPEKYLVKVGFPEAVGLLQDVDVRTAGITIGTVRDVEVEEHTNRAVATLALDEAYAPLSSDSRAILRRKTLLGETFVEITTGSADGPKLADGGRIADASVAETVELDEILQTYDPGTRRAFQIWQQQVGIAVGRRGEDLSNALNRLPQFTESGADLLEVLDEQQLAVKGLVRDTGEVYGALTRDESQLSALIRNSHRLFSDTASQRENLAEAFHIFPTFLEESRLTLGRLETFSRDTRPLVRDLTPVAHELRPTVAAARDLAPDLEHFFGAFDQQIDAARPGAAGAERDPRRDASAARPRSGRSCRSSTRSSSGSSSTSTWSATSSATRAGGACRHGPVRPGRRGRPLPAPARRAGTRVGRDPPRARVEQPRQRLPAAGAPQPGDGEAARAAELGLQEHVPAARSRRSRVRSAPCPSAGSTTSRRPSRATGAPSRTSRLETTVAS